MRKKPFLLLFCKYKHGKKFIQLKFKMISNNNLITMPASWHKRPPNWLTELNIFFVSNKYFHHNA